MRIAQRTPKQMNEALKSGNALGDAYDKARAIRKGEHDADLPECEVLKAWIARVPATWLPSLIRQAVASAVAEKVFKDGGLSEFVAHCERNANDPGSVLRDAGSEPAK